MVFATFFPDPDKSPGILIIAAPSLNLLNASPWFSHPQKNGQRKLVLVNEIVLICKSNSFALVDVIDPNGFKNPGLDEMTDTGTDLYGDRNDALHFLDERWVWLARNASLRWVRHNETTCTSLFCVVTSTMALPHSIWVSPALRENGFVLASVMAMLLKTMTAPSSAIAPSVCEIA
nr:hypothetical protein CFP56_18455 [Quercus suber]